MEVDHYPCVDSFSPRKKGFKEYFLRIVRMYLVETVGFFAINKLSINKFHMTTNWKSRIIKIIIYVLVGFAAAYFWHAMKNN